MKYLQAVLLLAACALPCGAQAGRPPESPPPPAAEYDPKNWKEFTSAEGRFSVLLPGAPQEGAQEVDTPYGRVTAHVYALKTFAQYAVSYADFPPSAEIRDIDAFFDGVREGNIKSLNGKLIAERDDYRLACPGRSYRAVLPSGHVIRARMFFLKNRLWQLLILTWDKDAPEGIAKFHEETAARFLDSFKLLRPSPAAAGQGGGPPLGDPKGPPAESRAEGEVDRLLKELREKGEDVGVVVGAIDDSAPPSSPAGRPEGLLTGKVLEKPAPEYPPIAKAARVQGPVVVLILVGEEGRVMAAQVESGHPLLRAAALKAVRGWVFSPTRLGGKPVKVMGTVTVNFTLQ